MLHWIFIKAKICCIDLKARQVLLVKSKGRQEEKEFLGCILNHFDIEQAVSPSSEENDRSEEEDEEEKSEEARDEEEWQEVGPRNRSTITRRVSHILCVPCLVHCTLKLK